MEEGEGLPGATASCREKTEIRREKEMLEAARNATNGGILGVAAYFPRLQGKFRNGRRGRLPEDITSGRY